MRLLSLLAAALFASAAAGAAKPNVIFVLADDQRFDTIAALGNGEIRTPNLDKLVTRGFAFTNAYCQGSMVPAVCAPSRTMILTGRSLFRIPNPQAKTYDGATLPAVFGAAGYATLHVGKPGNSFRVAHQQFDKNVEQAHHDAPTAKLAADAVIDFVKAQDGKKPYFVYLAPAVPHDPRVAPAEFHKLYDPAKLALSKNFMTEHPFDNGELTVRDEKLAPVPRTEAEMRKHLAAYYACITNLDHEFGRVLDAVKGADNTVVVFTSDQGLAVGGRHGLMGKQNLYEHFKSPLVLAGPGVPKGKSGALVYLFDLFPTLCDLAGVEVPKGVEGRSLVPVMAGKEPRVRDSLFAAYKGVQRMARDERWKLIWYPKVGRFQLFDLSADPDELKDLSADKAHAKKFDEMRALLAREQKTWGDTVAPVAYAPGSPTDVPAHRVLAQDKGHVAVVGADGKVEWEVPCKQNSHDIALLPGGNFLLHTGPATVTEMTPKKEVVWRYEAKPKPGYTGRVEVHAFERLADGNTLVAESGNRRLVEVDKAGKVVKEVALQVDKPDPHRDTRMARKLDSGNYLVCHEGDGCVREYDPTGRVVWEYKLDLGGRAAAPGHGPEGHGTAVYGALRLANGHTVIAGGNNNRVLEVDKAGKVVWSVDQKELPGVTLAWVTSLHARPNGNLIFGNCHAGPDNPQLIEVTRDKKVVWTFKDFKTFGNNCATHHVLDIKDVKR